MTEEETMAILNQMGLMLHIKIAEAGSDDEAIALLLSAGMLGSFRLGAGIALPVNVNKNSMN
jgi:hypothetical protein